MARRRQYIDIPDHARRDFIKWTIGLGAALGLKPWKIFEVNESIVGPALAQSASCSSVNRFVGVVGGNGGFAWMTQLFPFTDQATQAGRSFYKTGQAVNQVVEPGDHPMKLSPDGINFGGNRRVTGFLCGTNETHTGAPVSASTVATGVGAFAAVSALQTSAPTLVPAIRIGNLPYGTAAGAPAVATVANPAGMVDLFNSAASTAGGALASANDASLFEAYFKANLSLHRAANRGPYQKGFLTAKVASNLIGKNLASQLRPTADDLTRYGVTAGTQAKVLNLANTLITTVKAFKLNLTSSVMMPFANDDPHGAFANMATLTSTVIAFAKVYSAFMADLMAEPDPTCTGAKLADNTVIGWTGDTFKDPNTPGGWPDGTPGNTNILYVQGAGLLRSGWFGDIKGNDAIETWNPSTGANVPGGAAGPLAAPAGAALLYAVAKGDMRRVQDFYRGVPIDGVVKPRQM
jgi:hypothetical protein